MRLKISVASLFVGIGFFVAGCGDSGPNVLPPPPDLSMADQAPAPSQDLSMPAGNSDMASDDLTTGDDLTSADDLAVADLAVADLAVADLAGSTDLAKMPSSDLTMMASPDLVMVDGASPDMACVFGGPCQPGNKCHYGSALCVNGATICTDTGMNVVNATSCGVNMYCYNGACDTCIAGMLCTPLAGICHVGTSSCVTGAMTCIDTMVNAADGLVCGINLVCQFGACAFCEVNQPCTLSGPANCRVGTYTSCVKGPICTDSGPAVDGTPCQNNMTCKGGVCQ